MVTRAWVLIETSMGRSREVSLALQECEWVQFAERVTGAYDVVAIVQGQAFCDIGDVINDGIKPMDGIIRIVVCPISVAVDGVISASPVGAL
jgi:hypothetical protein